MTRAVYFDCFSGASGDMLLGAVVDCGVALMDLQRELSGVPIGGYRLSEARVDRAGIAAVKIDVTLDDADQPHRHLSDVLAIIAASRLPAADKATGEAVFRSLAGAEAGVHGTDAESVEFHEVGAVDAIVDVLGTIAGLRMLNVERCYSSPLPAGGGTARTAHGGIPIPGPATLALLAQAGAPIAAAHGDDRFEMVTPTGAALLTTLATFDRPAMRLRRVGYGAGGRNPAGRPNVLRAWMGEIEPVGEIAVRTMTLVETNLDDSSGEIIGWASERLFAAGAADVWCTAIQMKKGRPGVLLQALCSPAHERAIVATMLRETSTLGVRVRDVRRYEAPRESIRIVSSLGEATVKVKRLPGEAPVAAPEFEDCHRLALEHGLPLLEVYRIVQLDATQELQQAVTAKP